MSTRDGLRFCTDDPRDLRHKLTLFAEVEDQYQEHCRELDALTSGFGGVEARWWGRGWVILSSLEDRKAYLCRHPFLIQLPVPEDDAPVQLDARWFTGPTLRAAYLRP